MKRYSFVLKILLAVMTPAILSGQDIHFSQYTYSPLTLNPALTCAYKDLQVTLQFKDQWRMVSAYRTAAVTFEMKGNQMPWLKVEKMTSIYKKKLARGLAFGLHVFSDKAGDGNMAQTQGNFSLAYHALLNQNHTLSAGLMGGFVQRSISPDGLRFNNQYTGGIYNPAILPGENFINQTYVYGDYSAGLLWSYGEGSRYLTANDQRHINAGVSVAHINNPPQSFLGNTEARLYRKWTAHAGSLLGISNTKYSVGPSVVYMQQGPLKELIFGAMVKYKFKEESRYTGYVKGGALSLGCYYRNRDAIIPYFLIEMGAWSIGMSYDANVSPLTAVTTGRGGFEISLRFSSPNPFLYQNSKSVF